MEIHFNNSEFSLLLLGSFFVIISLFLFKRNNYPGSIISLTLAALILRLFMVFLDPFLNPWDEQFHALVAKNMMEHPFIPMLYTHPVLPYDIKGWYDANIWLHKPPLFLWLIAVSLKIFGINEFAVRLPSVIMSTLIVPIIFRIGKLIISERTGYCAAFLFALANFQLEIITGIVASDHNDIAFMFFTCTCFWAWIEYSFSAKKKWLYVIGLFAGMAVLTKWSMGLIVFFCWAITIVFDKNKRANFKSYVDIIRSFLFSVLVFAPWYLYIFIKFPAVAFATISLYSKHFTQVIEEHSGGAFYYIDLWGQQYGWLVPFIIIPAIYLIHKKFSNINARLFMYTWLIAINIFYMAARTKMALFTIICSPAMFIILGNLLSESITFLEKKLNKAPVIFFILLIIVGYTNINPVEIETHHSEIGWMGKTREDYIHDKEVFLQLPNMLPDKDYVVFNLKNMLFPAAMFYSGITVYNNIPDYQTYLKLKNEGIKMAVFPGDSLPSFITNDPTIIKLKLLIRP